MWLFPQSNSLLDHIKTTQNQRTSQRDQRAESLEGLCNLGRKFSGRGEHEGKEWLWFVEKGLKNGESKGSCLSATGFCDTNYIAIL